MIYALYILGQIIYFINITKYSVLLKQWICYNSWIPSFDTVLLPAWLSSEWPVEIHRPGQKREQKLWRSEWPQTSQETAVVELRQPRIRWRVSHASTNPPKFMTTHNSFTYRPHGCIKAHSDRRTLVGSKIRTMSLYSGHSDRTCSCAHAFCLNARYITHCSDYGARMLPALPLSVWMGLKSVV